MQTGEDLAVILAGGQARRMGGGDKGLLLLQGKSLLHHVVRRLSPQVRHIALNANGDPNRFAATRLPVLPDTEPGFPGPLAGILAAMDWAADHGATAVVTVAADTPFFPIDVVARLHRSCGPSGICLAATPGPDWHPTFGLWPVALRQDLRRDIRACQRKVLSWALQNGATPALFDPSDDPFFNINTPEDLAAAQLRAKASHDL